MPAGDDCAMTILYFEGPNNTTKSELMLVSIGAWKA